MYCDTKDILSYMGEVNHTSSMELGGTKFQ